MIVPVEVFGLSVLFVLFDLFVLFVLFLFANCKEFFASPASCEHLSLVLPDIHLLRGGHEKHWGLNVVHVRVIIVKLRVKCDGGTDHLRRAHTCGPFIRGEHQCRPSSLSVTHDAGFLVAAVSIKFFSGPIYGAHLLFLPRRVRYNDEAFLYSFLGKTEAFSWLVLSKRDKGVAAFYIRLVNCHLHFHAGICSHCSGCSQRYILAHM